MRFSQEEVPNEAKFFDLVFYWVFFWQEALCFEMMMTHTWRVKVLNTTKGTVSNEFFCVISDCSYSDCKSEEERKKRPRTAFTASQIKSLEAEFERNKYLSVAKRCQLSKTLKLTETQVYSCLNNQKSCFTRKLRCRSRYGFKIGERNGRGNTQTI